MSLRKVTSYKNNSLNPIMSINLLTLENLLDINELIKIRASKDSRIEYTGSEDYPIKIRELKKLIEFTPKNRTVGEIAAY